MSSQTFFIKRYGDRFEPAIANGHVRIMCFNGAGEEKFWWLDKNELRKLLESIPDE